MPHEMQTFRDQPLASTNLDSQGERLSRDFLEKSCAHMKGKRFPVHQQHDMSKPVAGYIENVKLVSDPAHPGEWQLVGDVFVDIGSVSDVLGGFSIAGTEIMRRSSSATALIYVPFPHYNDPELIALLESDPDLNVGKWIKKAAEPIGWVVLGSVIAFLVTPIWDDVYKRKIAPRIDALIERLIPILRQKNLAAELAQIVLFNGKEVEIRIIPIRGKEESCLGSAQVHQGLKDVVAFLLCDGKARDIGVQRVVIFFDESLASYRVHRIEYSDGSVEHVA